MSRWRPVGASGERRGAELWRSGHSCTSRGSGCVEGGPMRRLGSGTGQGKARTWRGRLALALARAARRWLCGGTAAWRRTARRLHAGTGRAGPGRGASGGRHGVRRGGDGGAPVRWLRRGAQGQGGAARAHERRRAGQRAAGGAATSGARRSRGHGEARACVHASGQEQQRARVRRVGVRGAGVRPCSGKGGCVRAGGPGQAGEGAGSAGREPAWRGSSERE